MLSASCPFTFSEPVDRATVGDQTIVLKGASGNPVPGAFSFSSDGAVVTLFPAAALKSETLHTLTVGSPEKRRVRPGHRTNCR